MSNRKQVSFRITEEQGFMLSELARITQQTKTEVVSGLIVGEYDRINGNPMAKQIIEQMNQLAEQMKNLTEGKRIN